MSISPINTSAQTGLVPQSLLGYSTNGVSAIEIKSTSITIGGLLNTLNPVYVGISAATGLTTTNPTGLDVNCSFNMNGNDITNLDTLSSSTGGDLTLSSQTGQVVINTGDNISLNAGENFIVNTNGSTGVISLNAADSMTLNVLNGNLVTNCIGLQIFASDFMTLSASNDAMNLTAGDDIILTSTEKGIVITGGTGDAGNNDITLTTQNGTLAGSVQIISATPTYFNLSTANSGDGVISVAEINRNNGIVSIISQSDSVSIQGATGVDLNVSNGALNLTTSGAGINLLTDADLNITTATEINIVNPTETFFNTTNPNTGDGIVYGNFYGTFNGNASSATTATTASTSTNSNISVVSTGVYYPNFTTNTSGSQVVLASSSLTYNATTNNLSATTFTGALSGNATSATNSTITDDNTNATYYPVFVSNNTGNLPLKVDKTTNPLSYNPSTGNLTSTLFTGLLSTGGLVYLSTGSVAITGSASATNFSLSNIFNSTYKNYRIVLAPTTQLTFNAYPSYSLQAFLGSGSLPTVASLYGFEITSSSSGVVSPVFIVGATISSVPLILAVSQVINHQTIIEVENVGFSATAAQQIGLKCKSFYSNPGVSGASDRSILASNVSGSTITGLNLQQSSISVGNNMTIGWTIYAYK